VAADRPAAATRASSAWERCQDFTVEDDGAFTTPWTGIITYRPNLGPWSEVVCAENIQWYSGKNSAVPPEVKNLIGVAGPTHADYGFGLGLAVQTTPGIVRMAGDVGNFSWPGANGTSWWADPNTGAGSKGAIGKRGQSETARPRPLCLFRSRGWIALGLVGANSKADSNQLIA
jgi:hypothetical protein